MPFSKNQKWDSAIIFLVSALLFLPFLGGVHLFDWDEINFAECSREMMLTGDYLRLQIDYQAFYEKPPLFIWLQVLSMKIWGINEYGARFPNAVAGILTLLIIFRLGKQYMSRRFGWWWVLCYTGSLLPYFYFKSGIIDPVFNLFIFLSIWLLSENKTKYTLLAGFFTGLAVLTKGPVALLLVVLTWVVIYLMSFLKTVRNDKTKWLSIFYEIPIKQIFFYSGIVLVVSGSWFFVDFWKNGPDFLVKFIRYQIRLFSTHDAGHKGFPGYHFIVLLIGCFPASIFAIQSFFNKSEKDEKIIWVKSLFWVVLILFSLVQSKIVHYSSACYLPLTFLAALTIEKIVAKKERLYPTLSWLLVIIGTFLAILVMILPILGNHLELMRPLLNKDPFALGNLEAKVNWPFSICLAGIFLILIIFARKYWMSKNKLQESYISLLIGTTIFATALIILLPGRIESYSQRAAIEFYKSMSGKEVDIAVYGFKSYAHLFYADKQPYKESGKSNQELLYAPVERPVYIVCKINHLDRLKSEIRCEEIGRKNGFVFSKRL